jgi:hypothetical protein
MSLKKYSDSPGNSNPTAYNKWWRAKTGKKYKDSPAAYKRKHEKRKLKNRYDHAGRPRTGDMGKPMDELKAKTLFPRTCGVRLRGDNSRNQKAEPNIVIDRSSPTIARLDAMMAEIDARYRVEI